MTKAIPIKNYFGRTVLYTGEEVITRKNLINVLSSVLPDFAKNQAEIKYLYNYYRGDQPILKRKKKHRPEINNKVVENHAHEIVSFKVVLATAVAENWEGLPENIKHTITVIGIAVGAASLVLGAILAFSGAAIPLGIGLMIAGAAELATAVVLGWNTLRISSIPSIKSQSRLCFFTAEHFCRSRRLNSKHLSLSVL